MYNYISERWVFKVYTEEEEEKSESIFCLLYHLKIKWYGIEEEEVEQNRHTSCEQRVLILKKKGKRYLCELVTRTRGGR